MPSLSDITGVTFQEWTLGGGTVEDVSPDQAAITKRFKVKWTDRWSFYRQLIGHVTVSGGRGGTIARVLPVSHPEAPWLYAWDIHTEPLGDRSLPGALAQEYEWGIVAVTFRTAPWQYGSSDGGGLYSGVYRSESVEMSAEMVQLPASAYKFEGTSVKVTHNVGRVMPLMTLNITQHFCPYIPYATLFQAIGRVNSQPFYYADPGTVLFMGVTSESQFGINADFSTRLMTQTLAMRFSYRPVPWNQFLMPDGNRWEYLVDQGGGYVYDEYDLNSLMFDVGVVG